MIAVDVENSPFYCEENLQSPGGACHLHRCLTPRVRMFASVHPRGGMR